MNAFKFSSLLAVAVALSLGATGCKHKPPPITRFPNEGVTGNGNNSDNLNGGLTMGPGNGPVQMGGGDLATFNPDDFAQDRSAFSAETLYFALDSSVIGSNEQPKLSAVASALESDPSAKLLIEGHCDERGTEEYNRSLGEKRALGARE